MEKNLISENTEDSGSINGNAGASRTDVQQTQEVLQEVETQIRGQCEEAIRSEAGRPPKKARGRHANSKFINLDLIEILADGTHVIALGDMEIWDGADLALLRETLVHLFHKMHSRRFCVDLSYVKYVPSGFFGMLYDWHEKGVTVTVASPQPQITNMRWFRQFFQSDDNRTFKLNPSVQNMETRHRFETPDTK